MTAPIWLLDLDDTLHNASAHIFPRINTAMTRYVADSLGVDMETANRLRTQYWRRYGATMLGMMRKHGTDPRHFLHHTHQFDNLAQLVVFDPALLRHLRRLPGRRYLFSNAPRAYLDQVLRITGLHRVLHGSFSIEDLGFHPKPQRRAYQTVLRSLGVSARRCIMVEDSVANLREAKRLGMRTVWVSRAAKRPGWVDEIIRDPLELITRTRNSGAG